ncbi:sporulation integral membrane protein YlbJ [Halobacillus massiliensis]|uniref:sporulation integral membrane protein YlbJ n=1 Tax=Halobacillus massiliensis TaxID=1926286 RepID=UPI001FE46FA4|nr:sporulation integral membrane protein YlbJ [Halobacillus massiliensis]
MISLALFKTIILTVITLFITFSLIQMPDVALQASKQGLELWWTIVFPSLLPFFIIAEILFGFGIVHGVGLLSERLMRPLFNVPGSGGFVWIMGMASGYPAGAKWTRELRLSGQVSRIEAERLVAFTNASSPLFILSAVAVGFFGDPSLGFLFAAGHYGGSVLVGIAMRFYGYKDTRTRSLTRSFSIKQAALEIHKARMKDGRPFGHLLGEAVTKSVQTLLLIGGFIMLFSVLTQLIKAGILFDALSYLLTIFKVNEDLHMAVISGIFELTTGIGAVTSTTAPLLTQILLVSFMLGFHGLSIQAQIASILSDTDIRFMPYFFARLFHGVAACVLVTIFYYTTDAAARHSLAVSNQPEFYKQSYMEFMMNFGPVVTITSLFAAFLFLWQKRKQSI